MEELYAYMIATHGTGGAILPFPNRRNSWNAPVPLGKMAHTYKVACHMKQSRPCHPASGCAELAFFCGFLRSRSNGWWQFVPCGAEYGNLVGRNVEEFSGSHLA
jgi:hypothetical protein